jgi:hypothetical protein
VSTYTPPELEEFGIDAFLEDESDAWVVDIWTQRALRQEAELTIPWVPYPKQALATAQAQACDELLFGGAAGPGKTEWLMRYGIDQMERYPGNRGVIFRRVFPSLQRSVIPRLQAILAGRAIWNENKHTFTFPNESILEVASLQYRHTVYDFQGAEYGWMGFEEITEFLESQYSYMLTRLRAPATADENAGIRPHACSTTNPGGIGHKWVKRRWVKPNAEDLDVGSQRPSPGEIWKPRFNPEVHTVDAPPLRRCYIPAVFTDNPALLRKDPGYLSRLRQQATRAMRRALEDGDWDAIDAVEGALWTNEALEAGRISPEFYRKTVDVIRRVVAVDPSDGEEGGDAYGVAVCARGADGIGYVEETHEWQNLSPRSLATTTLRLASRVQADVVVIEKNHGGKWMLQVFRTVDAYANLDTVWASDKKRTRAEPVSALFEWEPDTQPHCRARIVGIQEALEDELTQTSFTTGEDSPNLLDAVVWGLSYLMLGKGEAKVTSQIDDQRLAGRR